MRELIVNAIRWYVVSVLIVSGFYFLFWANAIPDGRGPLIGSVFSYTLAYCFGYFWHKYESPMMMFSAAIMACMAALAYFLPGLLYANVGFVLTMNPFIIWLGLNAMPGMILVMIGLKVFE